MWCKVGWGRVVCCGVGRFCCYVVWCSVVWFSVWHGMVWSTLIFGGELDIIEVAIKIEVDVVVEVGVKLDVEFLVGVIVNVNAPPCRALSSTPVPHPRPPPPSPPHPHPTPTPTPPQLPPSSHPMCPRSGRLNANVPERRERVRASSERRDDAVG